MDQPVNPPTKGPGAPAPVRDANDSQPPFFVQLGDFFRRNVLTFLIAGLALLIVQDIFGTHGVLAMHRSQMEANRIQQEKQRIDDENQKLQTIVKDLKSDPATIEGCARSMGYARKGEVIFKLPQKSADSACPVTPPTAPQTAH